LSAVDRKTREPITTYAIQTIIIVKTKIKLINFIGFQFGWFVCVLAGDIVGIAFTLLFVLMHLLFLKSNISAFKLKKEIYWLVLFFSIGAAIETLLLNIGVLNLKSDRYRLLGATLPPLWLLCLWILFATSMRTSLIFLFDRKWLGYLSAFLLAPASYYAGDKLNENVEIGSPTLFNLIIIGFLWMLVMSMVFTIKQRYFEDVFR
jgi:hypothetical protein